ncbi:ninja-family protein [Capsicum chacoense]|nr:ninja-family protein Os07g0602900 [Capsicum annuum]
MCELMGKKRKMLELIMKGNFEEDENGIGLSLSLSIGGSYMNKKMDCNIDDNMLVERQKRKLFSNTKGEIGSFGNECCTYDEGVKSLNLSSKQYSCVNDQRELMKKNVIRGEDCKGFRLYNENRDGKGNTSYNQCGSSESEEKFSRKSCFGNYKALLSNGSTERCSSTISECQSSSPKGRSSTDNAQGNQPCTSCTKDVMPIKEEQQQSRKSEINKCDMIQLLSRMPCVSATGTGPNGKTTKGLLCKYNSKTEINIVCVCHGKSFTPTEFVEHAGGVDVSQPLRHITVIPPPVCDGI